jgi:eukaryotic-like serine/threonine-protein kinase
MASSDDETTQQNDAGAPDAGIPQFSAAARYELGELIAKGGMGEVIEAHDRQIRREVAIKRVRSDRTSARGMARFFHEAMIQGRLDHPAILPVHEVGIDPDGRPFFVMKRLSGTTMTDAIGSLPRERLLRAFADVCLAVAFAHGRGVIHRDLKPANIGLGDFGEVYVLDWGIARVLDEDDVEGLGGSDDDGDRTQAGATIGTHGYMAPEQIRSASTIDARADVYSLGCILFEILAGERLHPKGTAAVESTLAGIEARPSLRGKLVPPELEALCVGATALDPDRRMSARELGERVQAFLDGDRDLAQRKDLARAHLATAERAFAERHLEGHRRTAIREAGRALALDPELAGAADLVTRLMLEPPKDIPPEVTATLAEENLRAISRNAKFGARSYLAFVAFIPILLTSGNYEYALMLACAIVFNSALVLMWPPHAAGRIVAVGLANALLIALVARLFSPFFVAPGVAAVATMALSLSPDYDNRRHVVILALAMVAAIIVPWLLEEAGLLSRTMVMTPLSISFSGPAVGIPEAPAIAGLVMYVVAILAAAAAFGHALRRAERAARTHLHLQAWQLAQLVPAR